MVRTHSLPSDTASRVERCARPLAQFPNIGPALSGEWDGYRFLLGPWPWMVLVYEIVTPELVAIVAVQDARSSRAATAAR